MASEIYRKSLNEVKFDKKPPLSGLLQQRYTLNLLNLINKRVKAFDTFIKKSNARARRASYEQQDWKKYQEIVIKCATEVSNKSDWVTERVLGMIDVQRELFDASVDSIDSIAELSRAYRGTLQKQNLRQAPM